MRYADRSLSYARYLDRNDTMASKSGPVFKTLLTFVTVQRQREQMRLRLRRDPTLQLFHSRTSTRLIGGEFWSESLIAMELLASHFMIFHEIFSNLSRKRYVPRWYRARPRPSCKMSNILRASASSSSSWNYKDVPRGINR